MNTLNESTKSLNTMTEVQEEQIQGGLKSALQEEAYGVVASVATESDICNIYCFLYCYWAI